MVQTESMEDIVDLARHPIADVESAEYLAHAVKGRRQYIQNGFCILPNFVNPTALLRLVEEANAVENQAYFCKSAHNVYLTDPDHGAAADDLGCLEQKTFVGSVAYDRIGDSSTLKRLFLSESLRHFVAAIVGKSEIYRSADPLGACSINVFVNGGEHGWHFDESEFSVTLMLQESDIGGYFQCVTGVRGTPEEKGILKDILNDECRRVEQLPFVPGTLLIFGGRRSFHRVTQVGGSVSRLVPVLCYSETPNYTNSDTVRRLFWGRTRSDAVASS
ncbi:MAG: hypothetical protein CMO98_02005 [Woeseia sp.]|nr:hypothetical protein [Woeseia sp.]